MLFCKNLGETRSLRCDGITTIMPNKSMNSDAPAPTATETPQAPSAARKIYPIVKYGDTLLEKPGAPIKKFDAELEYLQEEIVIRNVAVTGVQTCALPI